MKLMVYHKIKDNYAMEDVVGLVCAIGAVVRVCVADENGRKRGVMV